MNLSLLYAIHSFFSISWLRLLTKSTISFESILLTLYLLRTHKLHCFNELSLPSHAKQSESQMFALHSIDLVMPWNGESSTLIVMISFELHEFVQVPLEERIKPSFQADQILPQTAQFSCQSIVLIQYFTFSDVWWVKVVSNLSSFAYGSWRISIKSVLILALFLYNLCLIINYEFSLMKKSKILRFMHLINFQSSFKSFNYGQVKIFQLKLKFPFFELIHH